MLRICPKCSAYYAEATLTFCRVDGTPLVNVDSRWSRTQEVTREIRKAQRRQQRKLQWKRLLIRAVTTLMVTTVVLVVAANSWIHLRPTPASVASITPTPDPLPTPVTSPTPEASPAPSVSPSPLLLPSPSPSVSPSPSPSPSPVYKITGRVMSAVPLEGVTVTLSGARSASTTTDDNGRYSFTNLRAGGNYIITPVRPGMTFIPASRSLGKLLRDDSADFTSVIQPNVYKISGRVTDTRGPLGGVKINLEGSKLTSTLTDANGYYSFSDLREGGSYFVIPKGQSSFIPASRSLNNLRHNESADFSVMDQPVVYRISGRVRNAHQPLNGIRITLDGTKSDSTTTDTNGYYSFSGLSAGGNYTITPRAPLRFAPSNRSLNNLRQDGLADFFVEQENQTDETDKLNDTTTACTDADQVRERDSLLNKYAATWQRGIESEKPRVIEQAIKDQLPGVPAQSVEATASLGPIRYDVVFDKCKPRVVTASYQWQVKLYFNRESRASAVRKRKTCGKVLGAWICH